VNLFATRTLPERLTGQFIGSEIEGESAFMRDSGDDDSHDIGDSESHRDEDSSRLLLDLGSDSGTNYRILGHELL